MTMCNAGGGDANDRQCATTAPKIGTKKSESKRNFLFLIYGNSTVLRVSVSILIRKLFFFFLQQNIEI